MIGRAGLLVTVAIAAAIGLYHLKYEVAALEEEAGRLAGVVASERQAIHVLAAEWAYLNHPERLSSLVKRHLDLVPIGAERIISAASLPGRPKQASQLAEAGAGNQTAGAD